MMRSHQLGFQDAFTYPFFHRFQGIIGIITRLRTPLF
jgi:hypothetical protein